MNLIMSIGFMRTTVIAVLCVMASACSTTAWSTKADGSIRNDTNVLEIAQAKLRQDVSREQFLASSKQMHQQFLQNQPGFLGRYVWMQEDGQIGAVLRWNSLASAQNSLSIAMQNSSVQSFVQVLEPGSYQMRLVPVIESDPPSGNMQPIQQ